MVAVLLRNELNGGHCEAAASALGAQECNIALALKAEREIRAYPQFFHPQASDQLIHKSGRRQPPQRVAEFERDHGIHAKPQQ